MAALTCNPSTPAVVPQVQDQPGLHSEFQASLDYRMRPYLKIKLKQTDKNSTTRYGQHLKPEPVGKIFRFNFKSCNIKEV